MSSAICRPVIAATESGTSFNFLPETRAWLQPIAVAKSGWGSTNPSYEEIYEKDIVVGTPSPTGAGWIYPALFRSGETWLLLSETGLLRNYSGTRLQSTWRSTEYSVAFPDPLESFQNGAVLPESTLPWTTRFRPSACRPPDSITTPVEPWSARPAT